MDKEYILMLMRDFTDRAAEHMPHAPAAQIELIDRMERVGFFSAAEAKQAKNVLTNVSSMIT